MLEWRPVKDYEGLYEVSNLGQVRSLNYKGNGYIRELKTHPNNRGYLTLLLTKDSTSSRKLVHRLVAEAFIPNPENKLEVNHIDGNKANNSVNNLEWATRQENNVHALNTGLRTALAGKHASFYGKRHTEQTRKKMSQNSVYSKRIRCIETGDIYKSIQEASNITGVNRNSISAVCRGKYKTAGGYRWEYIEGE